MKGGTRRTRRGHGYLFTGENSYVCPFFETSHLKDMRDKHQRDAIITSILEKVSKLVYEHFGKSYGMQHDFAPGEIIRTQQVCKGEPNPFYEREFQIGTYSSVLKMSVDTIGINQKATATPFIERVPVHHNAQEQDISTEGHPFLVRLWSQFYYNNKTKIREIMKSGEGQQMAIFNDGNAKISFVKDLLENEQKYPPKERVRIVGHVLQKIARDLKDHLEKTHERYQWTISHLKPKIHSNHYYPYEVAVSATERGWRINLSANNIKPIQFHSNKSLKVPYIARVSMMHGNRQPLWMQKRI
jgi:hypothetical protein